MNRKRSHDDLDDADECLPISKRINSLHLEGKAHGICQRQYHQVNGLPNNNNNPEAFISTLTPDGVGVSSHPFLNHQQQNNTSLSYHNNQTGDKLQSLSSIPTDYNYNIASTSNMIRHPAHSYSHSQQSSSCNTYLGASNEMISRDPIMLNTSDSVHNSDNTHQSFPCNDNQLHHHNHQHLNSISHQQQQNLLSVYPSQSADPFVNSRIPMSSCPDVSLVNSHYATTHADISHHSNPVAATNLGHGRVHEPLLEDDLPNGPYDPELGMAENPHYYNNNKLLYEAHLSRLQRVVPDYQLHS